MDSIYFYNDTTLTVNLFMPSVLNWTQRGITVTQTTSYPVSDTTTLQVTGNVSGTWSMRVRIPAWTSGATVSVNGAAQNVTTTPGSYATLTRSWTSGDTVTVRLPMRVVMRAANDNANVAAVTYGPVVLSGNYGNTALSALPALTTSSVTRTSTTSLAFTATANGATRQPRPVLRRARPQLHRLLERRRPAARERGSFRLVNVGSGLVLGIQNMSTADGGLASAVERQRHRRPQLGLITDGTAIRLRNVNSGKVLGVENMSTADNARVLQWADNGTADHRWTLARQGDGTLQDPQRQQRQAARHPERLHRRARRPSRTPTTAPPTTGGASWGTSVLHLNINGDTTGNAGNQRIQNRSGCAQCRQWVEDSLLLTDEER